jgi:hypothetical protein
LLLQFSAGEIFSLLRHAQHDNFFFDYGVGKAVAARAAEYLRLAGWFKIL